MGVYLSSPITEKHSSDGQGKNFTYGASSMQGWRLTQEDAHNCLADFDEETGTAMLAVYDGHGGSEVAEYCALHLPDYIKSLQSYKDNNLNLALKEAFLGFDATLVTPEVVKELKALVNLDKGKTCPKSNTQNPGFYHDTPSSMCTYAADDDVHDENEAEMLRADANIPIEELVAKYQKQGTPQQLVGNKKKKIFDSPAIRPKKLGSEASDDDAEADSGVSSSSSSIAKITNGHADNENNLNTEKEFKAKNSAADSSISSDRTELQNNEVEEARCSESDTSQNSAQDLKSNASSSKTETVASSASQPSSSSSSSSISSSSSSTSSASTSLKDDSDEAQASSSSSVPGPSSSHASNWEPQPGSSGCSPKKKSLYTGEEGDMEGKIEDDDDEDEEEDDEEDSELDESDEEYEGDSSDDNGLDEEDEGDDDEEDDYDNQNLMKDSEEPGMDSGCTAVVALLKGQRLVVANAGDSRCVLCSNGKANDLSIDHKPEDEAEKSRIEAAGGKVTSDGRVNGGLNLSRAIGDHSYKQFTELPPEQQMITALPDLQSWTLSEDDEFLVLACDGIWNFMSSQEVVDFVKERLEDPNRKPNLSAICEEIFDYCLAPNTMGDGTGCDNMTCLIVDFKKRNIGGKKRTSEQKENSPDTRNSNKVEATPSEDVDSQPSSKRSKTEDDDN
ncbi:probable protein phosphatase 2C 58 isoform X1 [Octopus sinensis]|uniref:protein-serine/threonine phosphatase n=1 Tax=Octopus sinensis TaxID=2607531 RepID=A0A6P7SUY3_9MOLL|nr:probable protein phosphatase 2C 58 isoform X1 [Octopus sinensis]